MGRTLPARNAVKLALIALTLAVALGGCQFFEPAPQPTPTPSPTPQPTSTPTPTAVPTPMPETTPTTEPTVAPTPTVSSEEATQVVRDFFQALDGEDYGRMRELTADQASSVVDEIVSQVQQAERERNVQLDARVARLDITGTRAAAPAVQVDGDFTVGIFAQVGPISVSVREISGRAVFYVERVDGEPRIVRIEGDLQELANL